MSEGARVIAESLKADIDRLIQQNLEDSDLQATSQDYRDGYARGFLEAASMFVAKMARDKGL